METLVLFRPKVEKGEITWSDEEVSLPAATVERLFHEVPAFILKAFLSGTIKFPGFRNPHKVPRPMLFHSLRGESEPHLLSGILWAALEPALLELDGARVRDVRDALPEYVAEHGEDVMHVALLVHKRPGVRKLVDRLPELADKAEVNAKEEPPVPSEPRHVAPDAATHPSELAGNTPKSNENTPKPNGDASASAADADTTGPARANGPCTTDAKDSVATNGPITAAETNAVDHSQCQRLISRLERDVEQRDRLIQQERRQNGRLSEEIGQLRETLQQRDKALEELTRKFERLQSRFETYEQQAAEYTKLTDWEARLRTEETALQTLFGENQHNLKEKVIDTSARIHDLEATFTLLNMAVSRAQRRRHAALVKAPTVDEIPLTDCIAAVRDYIEQCGREAAAAATNVEFDPGTRSEAAETLQRHLSAIEHLGGLVPGDATVVLGDESTAINTLIAELKATEEVEFSLSGTVFYEGPHAWLRTEEHSLGLPSDFTDEAGLVTGDEVELHFAHSPDALFEWAADVTRKVERREINDTLRLDESGFWVKTPEGVRLDVSVVEMLRSGIQPDAPVQVSAPEVPLGATDPVYVRLTKALRIPKPLRRPDIGAARRARREAARLAAAAAGAKADAPQPMPKLLQGQKVLIVGGDGLAYDFLHVIKQFGGHPSWQSGFEDFARVGDRTGQADTVIVVTGRTSHAVSNAAVAHARRADVPVAHFNGHGRSSFERFLLDEFAPDEFGPGSNDGIRGENEDGTADPTGERSSDRGSGPAGAEIDIQEVASGEAG